MRARGWTPILACIVDAPRCLPALLSPPTARETFTRRYDELHYLMVKVEYRDRDRYWFGAFEDLVFDPPVGLEAFVRFLNNDSGDALCPKK